MAGPKNRTRPTQAPHSVGRVLLFRPAGFYRPAIDRELRPDEGFEPGLFRGFMKSRRAIDAIGVEQREGGIAERRRTLDERFRQ